PAAPRRRGGLPLLARRAGAGLSPPDRTRRRPRHRRQRAGDGLREPRRHLCDRSAAHARPLDGRAAPDGRRALPRARRGGGVAALAARLPEAAAELERAAARLERHQRDLCEIEFTVESGRLWILQARAGTRSARAALRIALDLARDPDFGVDRAEAVRRVAPLLRPPPQVARARDDGAAAIARGIGASPGFAP